VIYVLPSVQFAFDLLNNIIKDYYPIIFAILMLNIGHGTIIVTIHTTGAQLFRYIQNNDISLIRSNTYTHKAPRRNASNIDLFLIKDVSYNNTCYTVNDLSSNHLPMILKFDRVNITKKTN